MMTKKHILEGLNTHGDNFPLHVNTFIKELGNRLSIDESDLNKTVDSLYLLDHYFIDHIQEIDEDFINLYLMNFIAYVGEVFINLEGGRWEMVLYEDGQTWQPMIKDINGQIHERFWIYIYKTLIEDEYTSLRSCNMFS
jgi:hypothetical protein